jgi:ubiquinone/menaquinone biosynthesis C-methylase UbiE
LNKKVFDPKKIHVLESKERQSYQNTKEILSMMDLKTDYVVADLGCGSGVFTIPLSKEVNQVYAIDIEPKMLSVVNKKILKKNISNIKTKLSFNDKIPLNDNFLDFLLTVNTIHEFSDLSNMAKEIGRVLKPGGRLCIVDFKKKKEGFGPPERIRISSKKAIAIFTEINFKIIMLKFLRFDYFILFKKKD